MYIKKPGIIKICEACDKEYRTASGKHSQRCCSIECRRLIYKKPGAGIRHCLRCGKEFYADRTVTVYCSKKCAKQTHSLLKWAKGEHKTKYTKVYYNTCLYCSGTFISKYPNSFKLFCCSDCGEKHHYINRKDNKKEYGIEVTCKECGKNFILTFNKKGVRNNRIFCSDKCNHKYGGRMSKSKRKAKESCSIIENVHPYDIFKRDGWKCCICDVSTPRRLRGLNFPNSPELDHIVPVSLGGNHTWDNLQLLCRQCNNIKSNGVHPYGEQLRIA